MYSLKDLSLGQVFLYRSCGLFPHTYLRHRWFNHVSTVGVTIDSEWITNLHPWSSLFLAFLGEPYTLHIYYLSSLPLIFVFFTDANLKNLTQEVMELLKNTVGVEVFSYKYAIVHRDRKERSESRKRKKAIQVSDFTLVKFIIIIIIITKVFSLLSWGEALLSTHSKRDLKKKFCQIFASCLGWKILSCFLCTFYLFCSSTNLLTRLASNNFGSLSFMAERSQKCFCD